MWHFHSELLAADWALQLTSVALWTLSLSPPLWPPSVQQYYYFFPFPDALCTLSESEGEEGIVGVISGLLWQASFSVSEPGQEKWFLAWWIPLRVPHLLILHVDWYVKFSNMTHLCLIIASQLWHLMSLWLLMTSDVYFLACISFKQLVFVVCKAFCLNMLLRGVDAAGFAWNCHQKQSLKSVCAEIYLLAALIGISTCWLDRNIQD